ncbi:MAG: hypothetical protein UV57_C0005G0022 [Parcubacteria group bacterium GW2011_GWD2_43_10]|uniref:Uncharacterized protein n=4 Tax=Candidatus Vebleniibacteriota TaxID=1817921 RepID=A0A1G2Q7N0_9BACT|nr:MAG: hypothetical protein UV47_C0038G0007 [Parcubacteria group bacterium GW2011_GWA2_42_80]KKS83867.1 MAG: hypothetical protein UV57_C0005G0022 [Parcubacteria group bacterium GW2011_GWD2_43_10]KKS92446.1 MAG: hypothetical protein UV69_C0031G0008 [Parcubacteria group bacterium GW2011_GWE2_43_12]KKT14268.1 MAG: hypothetical protein UV96_C0036G0008 [Parcubacteria group bacterium GW2011_GWF2_43_38]KKT22233.1 MAG: hypothetical protein UW06_C0015G0024 [Parcubacteria group bacterium GW2011_GWE1_43_
MYQKKRSLNRIDHKSDSESPGLFALLILAIFVLGSAYVFYKGIANFIQWLVSSLKLIGQ